MLTEKQSGVLRGMLAGLGATVVVLALAILATPTGWIPQHGFPANLVYTAKWDSLIIICLTANIAALARHRFFTPEDIDGGGLTKGTPRAQVLQSVLQNTLEQTVLAFAVHFVWTITMPLSWQAVVPAAAILFFVGRVLFWHGYANGAPSRALGFALTFYPTVVMLALMLGRWLLL